MSIKLLKYWAPPPGTISSKTTGWYDLGTFTADCGLSFAQQIGRQHGVGRYLLLAERGSWWRELSVNGVTTYHEEGTLT